MYINASTWLEDLDWHPKISGGDSNSTYILNMLCVALVPELVSFSALVLVRVNSTGPLKVGVPSRNKVLSHSKGFHLEAMW